MSSFMRQAFGALPFVNNLRVGGVWLFNIIDVKFRGPCPYQQELMGKRIAKQRDWTSNVTHNFSQPANIDIGIEINIFKQHFYCTFLFFFQQET